MGTYLDVIFINMIIIPANILLLFMLCVVSDAIFFQSSNKFIFYEVYEGADDIAHHKEQPHYAAWVAFKESGGTISSVSKKASGKFMT